jgi:phosphoribosylformimino-5-aminoimidazole carboxamide ribotide isomerase
MSSFTVFPAIDLRAGQIVRLAQGDPERQTVYGNNPRAQAQIFKDAGAEWVHVINLSGAFNEDADSNLRALESILSVGLKVEFGGGIRDEETLRVPLEMGVERVFLGTAAIKTPELVAWGIENFGAERIAGDIGARDGLVMVQGWQESTPLTVQAVGERLYAQGVRWCVLTDVKRDGVGMGVDVSSAVDLQEQTGLQMVASGGVSTLEDVRRVKEAGLAGVIIGRALYEGKIDLRDILEETKSSS